MQISPLNAETTPYFEHLTFAEYADVLNDFNEETHIAIGVATDEGIPIGLALAGIPEKGAAILLSIFVEVEYRQQGIGTSLLRELDAVFQQQRVPSVRAYFIDKPHLTYILNNLLSTCGWEMPKLHLHVVSGPIKNVENLAIFSRWKTPAHVEVFRWTDVTDDDIETYKSIVERRLDDELLLSPFREMGLSLHEPTSVGIRVNSQLAGWMITHIIDDEPKIIRYSRMYIAPQYRGTRYLLYLGGAALTRHLQWQEAEKIQSHGMIAGYAGNPAMVSFAKLFGQLKDAHTETYYVSIKDFTTNT